MDSSGCVQSWPRYTSFPPWPPQLLPLSAYRPATFGSNNPAQRAIRIVACKDELRLDTRRWFSALVWEKPFSTCQRWRPTRCSETKIQYASEQKNVRGTPLLILHTKNKFSLLCKRYSCLKQDLSSETWYRLISEK